MLAWRVASADGHPVGGSLIFSVGAPSAGGPPDAIAPVDRAVQAALWLSKVVLYAGLFFGVGGAFFLAWIGPAAGRAKAFVLGALRLGLVAALLSVGLQGLDALGLPLTALASPAVWDAGFGTSYGNTATIAVLGAARWRSVSLDPALEADSQAGLGIALVGVGLALAAQRPRRRRRAALADAAGRVPARRRHCLLGRRVDAACGAAFDRRTRCRGRAQAVFTAHSLSDRRHW